MDPFIASQKKYALQCYERKPELKAIPRTIYSVTEIRDYPMSADAA